MKEDRISLLLSKKLSGEATEAESQELLSWLESHPEDTFTWDIINTLKVDPSEKPGSREWARASWQRLERKLEDETEADLPSPVSSFEKKKKIRFSTGKWWKIAAVFAGIIVLSGLFYLGYFHREKKSNLPTRIVMQKGSRSSVALPDGTLVWLNGGSTLTYKINPESETRDVFLDGEAYFKVKQDAALPFIVHTGQMAIKVLGTSFNVKAYAKEKTEQAALLSGKIAVEIKNAKEKNILLSPNERVTLTTADSLHIVIDSVQYNGNADFCDDIAWIYNKLVFKNMKFSELAREMERWYNITIVFKDTTLQNQVFSGVFEKENVTEALEALQLITRFSFSQEGKNIYLK